MFAQHGCENLALVDKDDERIHTMPILVLNAHSRCNCRCLMCDIWKRQETNEITAADLERHRESIRRLAVEWVVVSGGEPLMHGDLSGLCSFLRGLRIRLTLLTAGLLLARRALEVATLFDDIIVSLDGPPEIHDRIRRVKGSFELLRSGITAVRKVRPGMRVTCRTTVQKANHSHLRATVDCAKALALDGISFLAADTISEAFNRPLLWPAERQNEVMLSADEIPVLESEVEQLIRQFGKDICDGYIVESASKIRTISAHFKAQVGLASPESPRCNAPWVSAVIEASGTVRPCFFHQPIGNIHKDSLEHIVNGELARAFRRGLNVAENPVCKRCVCSLYRPMDDGGKR